MIMPIVMISLCLLFGMGFLIYKNYKTTGKEEENTAQDFVNVVDIKDNFLYTLDGYVMTYIRIHPISIELLSDKEKESLCNSLTAELSSISKPFKFLAVSRPVDISLLLEEYTNLLSSTEDHIQKALLRNEIYQMNDFALSGDVVERQFHLILWEKYSAGIENDLLKRTKEFVKKFENAGIKCDILQSYDIIRLCNLVNNPAYQDINNEMSEGIGDNS